MDRPTRVRIGLCCLSLALASVTRPTLGQDTASSRAFGQQVTLEILPILGPTETFLTAPLPLVEGQAAPSYYRAITAASSRTLLPKLGDLVQTGILEVLAASPLPTVRQAEAHAEVDDLTVTLFDVLSLVLLEAETVTSRAELALPCDGLPATIEATSTIENATLRGPLGLGLTVPLHPAPNTILLDLLGVRIVLNEQRITTGPAHRSARAEVNAIHVYLDAVPIAGLGLVRGDIRIAHSEAELVCDPPIDEV